MRRINPDFLRSKFKRWDKDSDGFLTLAEAEKMIKNNFRWLDKNKSKTITVEEMPKKF
jgi:Ca2+-binding EF-hand superfamily protein